MLYEELSPYRNNLPRPLPGVRNFGWLSEALDFRQAQVSPGILEKLERVAEDYPVALERGITCCPICGGEVRTPSGKLLGVCEVWIPDPTADGLFAAPDLIVHYIRQHRYCPPDEVLEPIRSMDLGSVGPTLSSRRERLIAELFRV